MEGIRLLRGAKSTESQDPQVTRYRLQLIVGSADKPEYTAKSTESQDPQVTRLLM